MHDREITAFIHRLSEPVGYLRATDRELLGLFLNDRDEAAFAVLTNEAGNHRVTTHQRATRTRVVNRSHLRGSILALNSQRPTPNVQLPTLNYLN